MVEAPGVNLAASVDALRRNHEMREAEDAARAAIAAEPANTDLLIALGRVLLATYREDDAVEVFSQAVNSAPDDDRAIAWRIAALSRSRWYERAITTGVEALERFADSSHVRIAFGRTYLDASQPDEALPHLTDAVSLAEGWRAQVWRVAVLANLRHWAELDAASQELLAKYPDEPGVHYRLGSALSDADRHGEALASFERALELDQNCLPAVTGRVIALRKLCRYAEAEAYADEAVEKFPRIPKMRLERAFLLDRRSCLDEALEEVARALETDPRNSRLLCGRIERLRDGRRFAEADQFAREAVESRPRDPDLRTAHAWVFSAQGRDDEAVAVVDEALAIDPRESWALRSRVDFLRFAHRFGDAEQAAHQVVESRPRDPEAHMRAAWVYSAMERYDEAIVAVDNALAIDPCCVRALRGRITLLRLVRRFSDAEQAAQRAVELHPRNPEVHVERAWVFSAQGREDEAVAVVGEALAIDPRNIWALRSRINFLEIARRFADAEQAAQKAVELHPRNPDVHVERAWVFSAQGREDEAVAIVDEALAIDPRDIRALRSRINFLRYTRRRVEAEQEAKRVAELHPRDPRVHLAAGWVYVSMGRYDEALLAAERAHAVSPANSWVLRNRIDFLRFAGRLVEAEQAAQQAVRMYPEDPNVRITLAWVLGDQGREDEAVAVVDETLAMDPHHSWALCNRIDFLRKAWRFTEAQQTARHAVELHPRNPELRTRTAWMYSAMGRYDEAIATVGQALEIDPRDISALRSRITFLRHARRFAEAEQAARQAIEIHPRDPDVLTRRAWVFSAQGREDDAIAAVGQALVIDPHDVWALRSRITFLRHARRFTEAERAVQEAAESHPRDPLVHITSAWTYAAMGRYDEALTAVGEALAVTPRDSWALRSRVDFLREIRRFAEAEQAAEQAIQLRPRDPEILVTVGRLRIDSDRYDDALVSFNEARVIDPYHVDALSERISVLLKLRRESEAELAAHDALQRHPTSADIQVELGRMQDHCLAFDAALTTFTDALRNDPDNVELNLARSATLRSMRRCREAERDIERLSRMRPHTRSLRAELGWIHHDERRFREARRVFAELLASAVNDQERAAARHGLGWVAFSAGDYVRAESEFRAACADRPDDFDYLLALAWALGRLSGPQALREAEEIASKLAVRRPEPSVYVCLGVLAYKGGGLASAEYYLKKALEIDRHHGSHADLGALYLQMGRYEEAEAELNSAISRDWYDATSHIELGSLYLHTSDKQVTEAEREFRRALAIDPSSGFAAIGLAQSLVEAGDSIEAESALRGALARQDLGQRWRVYLALARLLVQAGEKQQNSDLHAEAYAQAQRAIELAPDFESDPHFVAGVAHHRMGSVAADARGRFGYRRRAMHHLRECLKRESGHVDALRNIQLLEREMKAVAPAVWGGYAVATIALVLLATLWVTFFLGDKVTALMLTATTPVLVGLFTIAVLLPALIRLKLPGFEADLQAGSSTISPGPTGQVTFGPGRFTVSTGPTGQLPRLE